MRKAREIGKFVITQCIILALLSVMGYAIAQALAYESSLLALCCFAVGLLAFNTASLLVYFRLHRTSPNILPNYLLLAKVVRMLACVCCIVAYAAMDGRALVSVSLNVFVLYVAAMMHESIFYVRLEKNLKQSL